LNSKSLFRSEWSNHREIRRGVQTSLATLPIAAAAHCCAALFLQTIFRWAKSGWFYGLLLKIVHITHILKSPQAPFGYGPTPVKPCAGYTAHKAYGHCPGRHHFLLVQYHCKHYWQAIIAITG
jgi:hypothetical protein